MGLVRHRAQDDQEADASQATGDQDRVAQDNARPHRENRGLGETDAERASELLRCLGQPPEPVVVLQQGEAALARIAQAAQPKRHASAGRGSSSASPASFRQSERYTRCLVTASTPEPEGGARCVSSARRDLYGGRLATAVPTVTGPAGTAPALMTSTSRTARCGPACRVVWQGSDPQRRPRCRLLWPELREPKAR